MVDDNSSPIKGARVNGSIMTPIESIDQLCEVKSDQKVESNISLVIVTTHVNNQ